MRQELENGWIELNDTFLSSDEAWSLFEELLQKTQWTQGNITIFGKQIKIPRQEAFYSSNGQKYGYSGQRMISHSFTPLLQHLLDRIEKHSGHSFNSVLINLYRDGKDSNGWHADNEPELGQNPVIASLSLGSTRNFDLKHQQTGEKLKLPLRHGSLLIMGGQIQHFWKHQIAKSTKIQEPRINLTFRKII